MTQVIQVRMTPETYQADMKRMAYAFETSHFLDGLKRNNDGRYTPDYCAYHHSVACREMLGAMIDIIGHPFVVARG